MEYDDSDDDGVGDVGVDDGGMLFKIADLLWAGEKSLSRNITDKESKIILEQMAPRKIISDLSEIKYLFWTSVKKASIRHWTNSRVFTDALLLCKHSSQSPKHSHPIEPIADFLARATSLCMYVCMCVCVSVCSKFLGDVARRHTLLYVAVRLVVIAPLNCWRNSTPF